MTIPANAASAFVEIAPLNDPLVEQTETVVLSLEPAEAYVFNMAPGKEVSDIIDFYNLEARSLTYPAEGEMPDPADLEAWFEALDGEDPDAREDAHNNLQTELRHHPSLEGLYLEKQRLMGPEGSGRIGSMFRAELPITVSLEQGDGQYKLVSTLRAGTAPTRKYRVVFGYPIPEFGGDYMSLKLEDGSGIALGIDLPPNSAAVPKVVVTPMREANVPLTVTVEIYDDADGWVLTSSTTRNYVLQLSEVSTL